MNTYQNGGPIDGWNDCPQVPLLVYKKGSPSRAASVNRRRRTVSHDLNNLSRRNTIANSKSTINTPTKKSVQDSNSFTTAPPPPPPPQMRANLNGSTPSLVSSNESFEIVQSSDSINQENLVYRQEMKESDVMEKFRTILSLPTKLSAKEFDYYKGKLSIAIASVTKSQHIEVLDNCLSRVLFDKDMVGAKDYLIQYMLRHDGVSVWCVPLRKILENVTFDGL